MTLVIPIGGWVNLSGGGGVKISGGEWRKESLQIFDLQRLASLIMSKSRWVLPYKSDGGARRTF